MGLVQLVHDDPVAHGIALAERLALIGPQVLAAAKRALAAGTALSPEGFRVEGRAFLSLVNAETTQHRLDDWLAEQSEGRNPALRPSPLP
jgi:hypothetical protein